MCAKLRDFLCATYINAPTGGSWQYEPRIDTGIAIIDDIRDAAVKAYCESETLLSGGSLQDALDLHDPAAHKVPSC
jgi:hypothetical protein